MGSVLVERCGQESSNIVVVIGTALEEKEDEILGERREKRGWLDITAV